MSASVGTQLRGWDAATFRTASGDPSMRSTVVAVAILDAAPDWDRLRYRMERLTCFVPNLRMRPLYGAFGWSAPRLAPDPDFDLSVHLHRYRLPEGSGWADFLADMRRMSLTDFDRNRPLWEAILVEGLPNGEAAFCMKLHHSIADGQATVMIALSLFELGPDVNPDEPVAPPPPEAADVDQAEILVANARDNFERGRAALEEGARAVLGLARGSLTDPVETWRRTWSSVTSLGRVAAIPEGAMSPLMKGRGTTYHFETFELPFAGLRAAAKSRGLNVNDAFMAAVATGLDIYHREHGELAENLRVNVPISLRGDAGDRSGQESNAVSIARFPMPVAGLTIDERMKSAHDLVAQWKAEPAIRMADPLAEVSWFVPVPMLAQAARASDVTTSNVPGPPIPLYLAGARMTAAFPLVATIGAAVNITMVTYDGTACIGVSSDDRAIPVPGRLAEALRRGFEEVTGAPVGAPDRYSPASHRPGDTPRD